MLVAVRPVIAPSPISPCNCTRAPVRVAVEPIDAIDELPVNNDRVLIAVV